MFQNTAAATSRAFAIAAEPSDATPRGPLAGTLHASRRYADGPIEIYRFGAMQVEKIVRAHLIRGCYPLSVSLVKGARQTGQSRKYFELRPV